MPEPINVALAQHQAAAADWEYRDVAADLQGWAERVVFAFKLEIGTPALTIESLRRAYGHYRYGRNGFGLRGEIAIDANHIKESPYWCVLGTLVHELLHAWQERHGKPGKGAYHNQEFRRKAASLGLVIDHRGYTNYAPAPTPFFDLLAKHGVRPPKLPEPVVAETRKSKSKLKLYECPCGVKARIGRAHFNAQCLDCGGNFERKEAR